MGRGKKKRKGKKRKENGRKEKKGKEKKEKKTRQSSKSPNSTQIHELTLSIYKYWRVTAKKLASLIMLPIPASKLRLLQDLHLESAGTKVRFLGCIRAYDGTTATLTLTTPHPPPPRTAASTRAEVDISVPLPTLDMGSLADGQWVNVIGYIIGTQETHETVVTRLDAIALWSAGFLSPAKYREALEGRLAVEADMKTGSL